MPAENEIERSALAAINGSPQSNSKQVNAKPRRSTRRAAKAANERLNSTNHLHRSKDTSHARKLDFDSKASTDQANVAERRQTPSAKSKLEMVGPVDDIESQAKKVTSDNSELFGSENATSSAAIVGKLDLVPPGTAGSPAKTASENENQTGNDGNSSNTSSGSNSLDETKPGYSLELILLVAVARVFGGLFSLLLTVTYHGMPLIAKASAAVKVMKTRFGIGLFCLKCALLWLKDVPFQNKYARFFWMIARWLFIIYFLLPLCVCVIMHLFVKYHMVMSITGIALLAMI